MPREHAREIASRFQFCQLVMFLTVCTWQIPSSCLVLRGGGCGVRICVTRPAGPLSNTATVGHTARVRGRTQPDQHTFALGRQARPQLMSCDYTGVNVRGKPTVSMLTMLARVPGWLRVACQGDDAMILRWSQVWGEDANWMPPRFARGGGDGMALSWVFSTAADCQWWLLCLTEHINS